VIWALEKIGWVHDVRWPVKERIASRLVDNAKVTSSAAA
jgi:stearoyl-CoA desaturase (delta-9 desaturase)